MSSGETMAGRTERADRRRRARRHTGAEASALTGGGPEGNEELTATVGVVLIVLLGALGITIVRIGQLLSVHLFLGLLLIGPVALKMASTGYRFARYYTHNRVYVAKGPPTIALRLIAPAVVATTVIVFVTGVVLLFVGPAHRDPWLLFHKASFILWIGFTALHVLGHLPGLPNALRATRVGPPTQRHTAAAGAAGRWIVLAGALVGGLVLAVVLVPDFSTWTAHLGLVHHDHGGH